MTNLQTRACPATAEPCPTLADDLLRGADPIAVYMFDDKRQRRKVYHLSETTDIPIFKLGGILCARKSKLMRWIEQQEAEAMKPKERKSKDV
jgi:hypothetical protein